MQGPGDKDFEKMGLSNPMQSDSTSRSADSLLVSGNSGGLGSAARKLWKSENNPICRWSLRRKRMSSPQ